jgi:hypothetical protein
VLVQFWLWTARRGNRQAGFLAVTLTLNDIAACFDGTAMKPLDDASR